MRFRTLSIGVGPSNELDLSAYGHCNFVSSKHAVIYFDQYTQAYEMINYSEHGTIVDSVAYALNVRVPHAGAGVNPPNADKSKKQNAKVRI